ncbi:hypothetical protein SUGI_0521750 [Cryptomeria japonica]|uniref:uncharacterized protein LOC131063542 n=1 Tax=Cryptomeria japonica TaxID=3369 RepID=UPI002408E6D7|nr:uncharacterized protein LOC131063542 [Cryptomeria japonica]GLJ26766.1 hypothetical protein SUGI_0521750 [Cryptomeria japonica]
MAVRRQPLAVIQDENAEINRGKTNVAKSGGLKVQQTDLSDRKKLSNITNKLKPLPNLGKGGFSARVDPELSGKSGVKGRTVPRTPLGNISNVESSVQKGKPEAHSKNVRWSPNPNYEVTEEMKRLAEIWAQEGIEKCHFTGEDMDALYEKMAEEEMNMRVAQALGYRSEIPCCLPSALVEPTEIKDCLELLPVPEEDLELVRVNRPSSSSSSFSLSDILDHDIDDDAESPDVRWELID